MPDALLLDWEGCIVDTATMRDVAAQRALHEEGIAPDASFAMDHVLADIVASRASRAFAERLGKGFVVRAGARELLEQAQLASRVAIVTRATRSETEFVLRLAELDAAVSTIVSADDDTGEWPSPAPYLLAIAKLSTRRAVRADHSIAMATAIGSLHAARAAGVRTVALAAPAHDALEADGAVDSLSGLTLSMLAHAAGIPATEHSA